MSWRSACRRWRATSWPRGCGSANEGFVSRSVLTTIGDAMKYRWIMAILPLTAALVAAGTPATARLEQLHRLIKPTAGEARWAQVPWLPSSDIWGARQKAAAENKPLLLWYMAGEPLGAC